MNTLAKDADLGLERFYQKHESFEIFQKSLFKEHLRSTASQNY